MLPNRSQIIPIPWKQIPHPWVTFGMSMCLGALLFVISGYYSVDTLRAVAGKETQLVDTVDTLSYTPSLEIETASLAPLPRRIAPSLSTDTILAQSVLIRDVESNTVLLEKNADEIRSMASITKLMTALTLLHIGIDWEQSQTVIADTTQLFDTHLYPGDTYTAHELWLAMLVGSSNRAALSLVDMTGISREAFVEQMNVLAMQLEMNSTTFVEPTGLATENTATAGDIIRLLAAALEQPSIRAALQTSTLTIERPAKKDIHRMWNTNWLRINWIPHTLYAVVGGKTGYIEASLYNLTIRVVTSEGQVLDVVVLGAPTHEARFTEARDAVSAVLSAYTWGSIEDEA